MHIDSGFRWVVILLIASMLFEQGLTFFDENLGVSLYSVLVMFFLLGMFLILVSSSIKIEGVPRVLILLYAIYWIYSLSSIVWGDRIHDGVFVLAKNMSYFIILLLMQYLVSLKGASWGIGIVNRAGLVSLFVLLAFSLYSLMSGEVVRRDGFDGGYSISPFKDYNMYILILCFSLIFWMFGKKLTSRNLFVYYSVVFVIFSVSIIVGSRRSLVLYAPFMTLFPLFVKPKLLFSSRLVVAAVLLGLAFFLTSIVTSNIEVDMEEANAVSVEKKVERSLSVFSDDSNVSGSRTERWRKAANVIGEMNVTELLFGHGTRSHYSHEHFIRYDGTKDHPHNFILTAIIEGGFFKLTILLLFVSVLIFEVLRLRNPKLKWSIMTMLMLWLATVSISGEEFFASKQVYLIMWVFFLSRCVDKEAQAILGRA